MAFNFNWNEFSTAFVKQSQDLLTAALNKGIKPSIIADDISVKELYMGSTPPELELVELGDLAENEFRGVFRLKYAGDAHLVLQTKVQANPLLNRPVTDLPFSPVQIVAADAPLEVPMFLQLSDMKLNGIVILLFTKSKGLSIVFRNDPLHHVLVTSTFDGIPAIRNFLQCQIEKKLRHLVCDELPAIIHILSLAWSGVKRSPKVRPTNLDFSVPAMLDTSPHNIMYCGCHNRTGSGSCVNGCASGGRSAAGSGYNTPRSIPYLYRNQSFTGRGQLTPFTPAIAQAIYKSTSLSALDLAERRAKALSTSPRSSPKRPRKQHRTIRLSSAIESTSHNTDVDLEDTKADAETGDVSSSSAGRSGGRIERETQHDEPDYFHPEAPKSPLSVSAKKRVSLTPIVERAERPLITPTTVEKSPRTPSTSTSDAQKVHKMQQLLNKKLNKDRRSSAAELEDDISRLVI